MRPDSRLSYPLYGSPPLPNRHLLGAGIASRPVNLPAGLNRRMEALTPEDMAVLRLRDVVKLTSLSSSTIYKLIRQGTFPQPLRLSRNRIGWTTRMVLNWLESGLPASTNDDDQPTATPAGDAHHV